MRHRTLSRLGGRGPGRHAILGIADQSISSLSNFVMLAVAAKTSSVEDFGAFVVAYTTFGLALGAGRAVGGDVLLLRAAVPGANVPDQSERLLGVAILFGLLAGGLVAGVSVFLPPSVGGGLRVMAVLLPVLLLQDALRYCAMARRMPADAVRSDVAWAIGMALALAAIVGLGGRGPELLILGWGAGGAAGAIVALFQARLVPRVRGVTEWVTHDLRRVGSFTVDFVLNMGAVFVAFQLVAVIAGLSAVGALRGAQIFFAPFAVLLTGGRLVYLPALGAAAHQGMARLRSRVRTISLTLYLVAAIWAVGVLLIPDSVGTAVLGSVWEPVQPLLPWTCLFWVVRTGASPALDGLRALGGGRRLVNRRLVSAVLVVSAAVTGSLVGSAIGAAVGLSIAACISVLVWWDGFRRATAGPELGGPGAAIGYLSHP